MTFTPAMIFALAVQCAPGVAPQTVVAIVRTESGGNPFALNVNWGRQPARQTNVTDAAAIAKRYVAAGYSVDLGLGQINSRNMVKLGLSWNTIFDPCTNIAALGQILSQNYKAVKRGRHPQTALRLAISLYNTGSLSRGFSNGYVAKVVANAGATVATAGEIGSPSQVLVQGRDTQAAAIAEIRTPAAHDIPPAWNLFERVAYERQTLIQTAREERTIPWAR